MNVWLRTRTLRQSTRGEADAQQIYADIIGALAADAPGITRANLERELKNLEKLSDTYSTHGLVLPWHATTMIDQLKQSPPSALPLATQIIKSFVDGQKARLDALSELNNVLIHFIDLINSFLVDKMVHVSVQEGVLIRSASGDVLNPTLLSSGEKQLLLLFLNVVTASEESSLFLIDEPELSLNVKWQRELINSLLNVSSASHTQFIMATHSIELLTKQNDSVVKLTSI